MEKRSLSSSGLQINAPNTRRMPRSHSAPPILRGRTAVSIVPQAPPTGMFRPSQNTKNPAPASPPSDLQLAREAAGPISDDLLVKIFRFLPVDDMGKMQILNQRIHKQLAPDLPARRINTALQSVKERFNLDTPLPEDQTVAPSAEIVAEIFQGLINHPTPMTDTVESDLRQSHEFNPYGQKPIFSIATIASDPVKAEEFNTLSQFFHKADEDFCSVCRVVETFQKWMEDSDEIRKDMLANPEAWANLDINQIYSTHYALSEGREVSAFVKENWRKWKNLNHHQMIKTENIINEGGKTAAFVKENWHDWKSLSDDQMHRTKQALNNDAETVAFVKENWTDWTTMSCYQMAQTTNALNLSAKSSAFVKEHWTDWKNLGDHEMKKTIQCLLRKNSEVSDLVKEHWADWKNLDTSQMFQTDLAVHPYIANISAFVKEHWHDWKNLGSSQMGYTSDLLNPRNANSAFVKEHWNDWKNLNFCQMSNTKMVLLSGGQSAAFVKERWNEWKNLSTSEMGKFIRL